MRLLAASVVVLFLVGGEGVAQTPSSRILDEIIKLGKFGRVMYLAAHPDDENTQIISYLTHGRGFLTCYVSLTRGDGGQNLLGSETGVELGIIRTQELLEARKIDGALQFFTRAYDFGFSKRPEETFLHWEPKELLADLVKIIRDFKPDVILTRFSPEKSETHGHHTASAILALQAVDLAADSTAYPESLPIWRVRRVLWNTSSFFYGGANFDKSGLLAVDVGGYSPLLGQSFGEIAALSRSKHRSQGFGTALQRGSSLEYFKLLKGDSCQADFMQGVDTSWASVKGGALITQKINEIVRTFNPQYPQWSLGRLIELHQMMEKLPEDERIDLKISQLEKIIADCAGLHLEVRAENYFAHAGKPLKLVVQAINRSSSTLSVEGISFPDGSRLDTVFILKPNYLHEIRRKITIPAETPISQPFWLDSPVENDLFVPSRKDWIGLAENPETLEVEVIVNFIKKLSVKITVPVRYVWVEPDKGQLSRKVEIRPPASLELSSKNLIFTSDSSRELVLNVRSFLPNFGGKAKLQLPEGWQVSPESVEFFIEGNQPKEFIFKIKPLPNAQTGFLSVKVITQDAILSQSVKTISYDHISPQTYFPQAKTKLIRLNLNAPPLKIGYIEGAGDEVPASLRAAGFSVDILSKINWDILKNYDVIILGIRAYNVNRQLVEAHDELMKFVAQGGTVLAQYNTDNPIGKLLTPQIGPFPLKLGRERVTDETALVGILDTAHPAIRYPNRIEPTDFEGWVQERGLYFAKQWDESYQPLFSINDPGESPKLGSLLIARYGRGVYIYTGLSFFRQLPAGVPGAYRLFVNLLSLK